MLSKYIFSVSFIASILVYQILLTRSLVVQSWLLSICAKLSGWKMLITY